MGYLLVYLLLFICLVVPPVLIYRTTSVTGSRKTAWVTGCFLSAFTPGFISIVGIIIAMKFGGYQRTGKSMLFGPEAYIMWISNIAMFVLPWVTYFIFRAKYAKRHP